VIKTDILSFEKLQKLQKTDILSFVLSLFAGGTKVLFLETLQRKTNKRQSVQRFKTKP
jgi:hypothetical protein